MPENVLNSALSTQHSALGISVYNLLKTINYPRELRDDAIAALSGFGDRARRLAQLADFIVMREF